MTHFFANPWFLLLLLLVPLVLRRWRRRAKPALRHPDADLLTQLPSGRSAFVRWAGTAARALVLVLLILALAGPRWPGQLTRIPTQGVAIAILVDVSGSMAEKDFEWQGEKVARLAAVKRAFELFVKGGDGPDGEHLEGRAGDLVSLVTFATRPETLCPLTLSHHVLLDELNKQEPRAIPDESETNISDAIIEGTTRLVRGGPRRKVMLLLSDGEHNVTPTQSGYTPRQAAQIAGSLGIPIYAIDAGSDPDQPAPNAATAAALREAGLKTLHEVAKITGGQCFPAHDTKTLLEVCGTIDRLERDRIESYQYRHTELFSWIGLAAFCALFGLLALDMTVWQRIP